jgi:hypothetical protein
MSVGNTSGPAWRSTGRVRLTFTDNGSEAHDGVPTVVRSLLASTVIVWTFFGH